MVWWIIIRRGGESYDKTAELYDRNGELVRSQLSDNLEAYNHAAYGVQEHGVLLEEAQTLFHRKGEAYVMENHLDHIGTVSQ